MEKSCANYRLYDPLLSQASTEETKLTGNCIKRLVNGVGYFDIVAISEPDMEMFIRQAIRESHGFEDKPNLIGQFLRYICCGPLIIRQMVDCCIASLLFYWMVTSAVLVLLLRNVITPYVKEFSQSVFSHTKVFDAPLNYIYKYYSPFIIYLLIHNLFGYLIFLVTILRIKRISYLDSKAFLYYLTNSAKYDLSYQIAITATTSLSKLFSIWIEGSNNTSYVTQALSDVRKDINRTINWKISQMLKWDNTGLIEYTSIRRQLVSFLNFDFPLFLITSIYAFIIIMIINPNIPILARYIAYLTKYNNDLVLLSTICTISISFLWTCYLNRLYSNDIRKNHLRFIGNACSRQINNTVTESLCEVWFNIETSMQALMTRVFAENEGLGIQKT